MNTAGSTSPASWAAIIVTVVGLTIACVAIVARRIARYNQACEDATKRQREQSDDRLIELLLGINKEDRLNLARFALWLSGFYPADPARFGEMYVRRVPSEVACKDRPEFKDLHARIVSFAAETVMVCVRANIADFNALKRFGSHQIADVCNQLKTNKEFLMLCARSAPTLDTYLDFYYDSTYGLVHGEYGMDASQMLTQQMVSELGALRRDRRVANSYLTT